MIQPYVQDRSGRTISLDGAFWWDGRQWSPTGRPSWARPLAAPSLQATLAVTFLSILIAVNVFDIINSALDLAVFGRYFGLSVESAHGLQSTARNTVIGLSWLAIAFPGSVITVSVWVYRAYRNMPALGYVRPATSPAMAVAWFFIPIANLWQPLRVMREIAGATLQRNVDGLVGVWWACWLAGAVAGNIQMQLSIRETTPASHILPLLWSFASDLLYIAAALLLIKIIRSVTKAQESGDMVAPGTQSR